MGAPVICVLTNQLAHSPHAWWPKLTRTGFVGKLPGGHENWRFWRREIRQSATRGFRSQQHKICFWRREIRQNVAKEIDPSKFCFWRRETRQIVAEGNRSLPNSASGDENRPKPSERRTGVATPTKIYFWRRETRQNVPQGYRPFRKLHSRRRETRRSAYKNLSTETASSKLSNLEDP